MIQVLLCMLWLRVVVVDFFIELLFMDMVLLNGCLMWLLFSYVFMLDIDGVLYFVQLGMLLYLLMLEVWFCQYIVIDVVIFLKWKDSYFFDDLVELFSIDVCECVIGIILIIEDVDWEQEVLVLVV